MNTKTFKPAPVPWRWIFALTVLQAAAAFMALVLIPGQSSRLSAQRVALLGVPVLIAVLAAAGMVRFPHLWAPLPQLVPLAAALAILSAAAAFLLRYLQPIELAPYYMRLAPLLILFAALGAEYAVFMLALRTGLHPAGLVAEVRRWRAAAISLAALAVVGVIVAFTGLGIRPDPAYWGEPGVPVMGWQLVLVILAGLLIFIVLPRLGWMRRLDAAFAVLLWLLAMVIWLAVPIDVMRNSFYAPMNPPTGQPFPNSDAAYYDSMAQSLLIGYPYQGQIPTRPLYVVVLTFLHIVFGQRYLWIIAGQTAILALIPVALFLLAARLHSPVAGVVVGLFAISREWTTLLVSSQTRVSNTKTLLVDLPTLLLILLAALAVSAWFRRRTLRGAVIAGGTFGLLLLLRTQAFAILPFIVVLAALVLGLRTRRLWLSLGVFFAALALTIVPWLLHNYLVFGTLSFDAPFQGRIIASQYRFTGNLDINNVDLQGSSLAATVIAFTMQNPGFVLGFVANHFLATEIGGILALPLFAPFNGLLAPINLYWIDWTAILTWQNLLLILGYLGIISLGIGAAWRRWRWIALVPLAFSVGYALANGLGRFSGWRYDLPADWVAYFYFGLGIAELLTALGLLFSRSLRPTADSVGSVQRERLSFTGMVPLLAFVLVGASPWLAEGIAAPRYAALTESAAVHQIGTAKTVGDLGLDASAIAQFAEVPHATVQVGRVLYPRFFRRGDGLASAHPWPAYAPREFPRLGFVLLNDALHDVVLPSREPDSSFSHAADAIVLGCDSGEYVDARLVFFPASGQVFIAESPMRSCP